MPKDWEDDDMSDMEESEDFIEVPKGGKKKKNIEEIYKKLEHLEHVLQRPDMYIGSITMTTEKHWVYDKEGGMTYRKISFVPGLYKIFDEILVNAADNKQRDPNMQTIRVTIDPENNLISVFNDGQGIPVVMHKTAKMWVPQLIFGELLTGTNFDDDEAKLTGGRNGLGAKLANIFSTEFIVECIDSDTGKRFYQEYKNNLSIKGTPKVTENSKKSSTKITFKPDLARFGMEKLDTDIVALMTKRVYDVAGCNPTVKVYLNDERIMLKSFQKYCELFLKDESKPKIYEQVNERWQVCLSISNGEFQQVSFVNSICTTRGGNHVKDVTDKIVKVLMEAVKKKNKGGAAVTPAQVKNHLWVFVNCLIVNPAFGSQTKETLTTSKKDFGSKCDLSEDFMKKVAKSSIVEEILNFAKLKGDQQLKKQQSGKKKSRLLGIPKLDDANCAGGKDSELCTLILTEGDSAKTTATSGVAVVGRDHYGLFPLRGKLLNVRDATHKQIIENQELKHLTQILGLQHGKDYTSTKGLRYGHIMIMTDQDVDGSHIKGLLINFIHKFWPSLLKVPGFLTEFITPLVKAKKGKQEISFFSIPEFKEWKAKMDEKGEKGWQFKYYKGLGTSMGPEARKYFAAIEDHQIEFAWKGEEDGERIDLAFSKKRIEDRKEWLRNYKPGTYLDHHRDELPYSEFVDKELILFSLDDCHRSIPSMVDGLKPGQRKILYSAFKKNIKTDIKVAQFAGYVGENSAYHHGEASLQATIVNMAQDFVGANNINLLFPAGQFGTRLMGGKDAANARYIFTRLAGLTRYIFPKADDNILTYTEDDGMLVEPTYYAPIIPMVLVNGAEGIGTGWSTKIPNYNPKDIIRNIKRLLNDEPIEPMHPWYRGFKGSIEPDPKKPGSYRVTGCYNKLDENTIEITELPIETWTTPYKEMLESFIIGTEKKPPILKELKDHHTDTTVHFIVEFLEGKLAELEKSGQLEKTFKLSTTIATTNLVCYDEEGRIRKFDSVEEIFKRFYNVRLDFYNKRKEYLLEELNQKWTELDNKVRFILAVVKEEIIVRNRKKAELLKELAAKKFTPIYKEKKKKKKTVTAEEVDDGDAEESESEANESEAKSGYDYLLSMPLWSLTLEKVEALIKQRKEKEDELKELMDTPIKVLWERDLDAFEKALDDWYAELAEIEAAGEQLKKTKGKGRKGGARKAAATKRKKQEQFSDDEEDEWDFKPSKKATSTSTASSTTSAVKKETAAKTEKKVETKPAEKKKELVQKKLTDMKPAEKKLPLPLAPSTSSALSVDSDDDDHLTFAQRLAKKASSPEQKKALSDLTSPDNKRRRIAGSVKAFKIVDSDDESEDDDKENSVKPNTDSESDKPKKAPPAKKSTAASKKRVVDSDDSPIKPKSAPKKKKPNVVVDSEEEEEETPKPKPKTTAAAKKTTAAAKKTTAAAKKKANVVDSEDEDDLIDLVKPTKTSAAAAKNDRPSRAAAARKTFKYADSESEEEAEESEESASEDDFVVEDDE